jgi:hypothetical protein
MFSARQHQPVKLDPINAALTAFQAAYKAVLGGCDYLLFEAELHARFLRFSDYYFHCKAADSKTAEDFQKIAIRYLARELIKILLTKTNAVRKLAITFYTIGQQELKSRLNYWVIDRHSENFGTFQIFNDEITGLHMHRIISDLLINQVGLFLETQVYGSQTGMIDIFQHHEMETLSYEQWSI